MSAFSVYCQRVIGDCLNNESINDCSKDFVVIKDRLEPIINAAKTIKNHWDGVLRWFTSIINNGILEGINSLIQAAKARARGYRTKRNLITMIYLIAGKFTFDLPT